MSVCLLCVMGFIITELGLASSWNPSRLQRGSVLTGVQSAPSDSLFVPFTSFDAVKKSCVHTSNAFYIFCIYYRVLFVVLFWLVSPSCWVTRLLSIYKSRLFLWKAWNNNDSLRDSSFLVCFWMFFEPVVSFVSTSSFCLFSGVQKHF